MRRVGHFSLTDNDLLIKHIADTELDREVAVKIPRKGQLSGEDALPDDYRQAVELRAPEILGARGRTSTLLRTLWKGET